MNRKIPLPKKHSVTAEDMPDPNTQDDKELNADLDIEKEEETPRDRTR